MDEAIAEQTVRKMKAETIVVLIEGLSKLAELTRVTGENVALREKLRKAIEDFDAA